MTEAFRWGGWEVGGLGGGGGVTQYGTLVRIHVQKNDEKRDFCHRLHRLVGSRDLQKGDICAKKGRCLTVDTPVAWIKGVL